VLAEMRSLGLTATELGAPGFLPEDVAALRRSLEEHGMELVGGFVPLVLHDPAQRADALRRAEETAGLFEACGGTRFVTAVVEDYDWARPNRLDADGMKVLAEGLAEVEDVCVRHGLVQVLHPHVGTLVETAADVELALELSSVRWCLDTGHLQIGGIDPVAFARDHADRVGHVHLKDVSDLVAAKVSDGTLSLVQGVQQGLFQPLGAGDVAVDDVVVALEERGYQGWYVLEQDTALTEGVPAEGSGPVEEVQKSLAFLRSQVVPRVTSAPIR
jgi:inosose dehydratase